MSAHKNTYDEYTNEKQIEVFRVGALQIVDWISTYLQEQHTYDLLTKVKPGYLHSLIPKNAPIKPQPVEDTFQVFKQLLLPASTNWNHPKFFAYYPIGNAYGNVMAEMLCDVVGGVGFSWTSQPSLTDLENVMMDWTARALRLPKCFIFEDSKGVGGGCSQGSASEAILCSVLAARYKFLKKRGATKNTVPFNAGPLLNKMICYASSEAHSAVQKAAHNALVTLHQITPDNPLDRMTANSLNARIEKDKENGLHPFYVCVTIGTPGGCAFDDLTGILTVVKEHDIYVHADCSYAGCAFILPKYQYLAKGLEDVDSLNVNTSMMLLVAPDMACMWMRDTESYLEGYRITATYLINENENDADKEVRMNDIEYRHYGVSFTRRMRALKLWFVFRMIGVRGLKLNVQQMCTSASHFEKLIQQDDRFEITNIVTLGVVCFRQKPLPKYEDKVNKQNLNLLQRINHSNKLMLSGCLYKGQVVLRFSANNCQTTLDIVEAWKDIQSMYVRALDQTPGSTDLNEDIRAYALSKDVLLLPSGTSDIHLYVQSYGPIPVVFDTEVANMMNCFKIVDDANVISFPQLPAPPDVSDNAWVDEESPAASDSSYSKNMATEARNVQIDFPMGLCRR